jgi:hypothetical protein
MLFCCYGYYLSDDGYSRLFGSEGRLRLVCTGANEEVIRAQWVEQESIVGQLEDLLLAAWES